MDMNTTKESSSKKPKTPRKDEVHKEEQTEIQSVPEVKNMKALWDNVKSIGNEEAALEKQLEEIRARKSEVLGSIKESQGTGPFQVSDIGLVTIRARKAKEEGGKPTYFFVTMGNQTVTVIE